MKKTEKTVRLIRQEIEKKDILEVACGTADFSLSAAEYAKQVICIDIDSGRLDSQVKERDNISFQKMDAAKMEFEDEVFDTIILYNALYHIKEQYDAIMAECRRVLKPEGHIVLVATWKLDSSLMSEMFGGKVEWLDGNCIVKLGK